MNEFWWAMIVFILLGLTPLVTATIMNRRQRRAVTNEESTR